jgi:hypothetical protein
MKKSVRSNALFGPAVSRWIFALVLLPVIAGQPGCKKSEVQPQVAESRAVLNLASKDGAPVDELILDSTHETLVPINKKEGWPTTTGSAVSTGSTGPVGPTSVAIRYIDAGKSFSLIMNGQSWHYREVYLISFRVI